MAGGGSMYFPKPTDSLKELIEHQKERARKDRLEAAVNQLLRQTLASFERDPDEARDRLDKIEAILKDEAEMERFLFGGSVAKHTYVDGLSDIDALVVLNRDTVEDTTPQRILAELTSSLKNKLLDADVASIERGTLAITVKYSDGREIQLLPAMRVRNTVAIPSANGKGWNETKPKAFQRALTAANQRLNSVLVPTIKLVKSVVSSFPKQKQLTGYHAEALALEAVRNYRGDKTPKALLSTVLGAASERVLRPIRDVTKQSRIVDSYLGKANSTKRRIVADALAGAERRLQAAVSVDQWRDILGI